MVRSSDSQNAAAGTAPPWPWADEKWTVLANFEVDDLAFSDARRFCNGGRRNAAGLASYWRRAGLRVRVRESKSKSKSKSKSRSGAVERLSVRGGRDGPPLALGC